jgi:PAS domain S-box-containing protein
MSIMDSQTTLRTATNNGKVLVVEDEAIVAADIASKVSHLGYEVVGPVPSGEEAVSIALGCAPDIVLMDIGLQGRIDGLEAAARIHHDYHLPVIYLTGRSDPAILDRIKVTEPFGYLTKPLDEPILERTMVLARARYQAELSLYQKAERFRALSEAATDAIFVHQDGRILEANRSFLTLMGYAQAEVLLRSVEGLVGISSSVVKLTESLMAVGDKPYESTLARKDGSRFLAEIRSGQILYYGRPVMVSAIRDITPYRKVEETLRESQMQLVELLGRARVGTLDWNIKTGEIRWSDYQYVLFGYRPREVTPSFDAWMNRVLQDERPGIITTLETAILSTKKFQVEFHVRWPDESIHGLRLTGLFVSGLKGETYRLIGVTTETTEGKPYPSCTSQPVQHSSVC